jgi:hypothetical protein
LVTTQSFIPPSERVPDPQTGGGKIKLKAPIVAPIPIPRSIWGIVLPIGLVVGVIGLIKVAIPMHYNGFHIDGLYQAQPDELSRFLNAAAEESYEAAALKQGEDIAL